MLYINKHYYIYVAVLRHFVTWLCKLQVTICSLTKYNEQYNGAIQTSVVEKVHLLICYNSITKEYNINVSLVFESIFKADYKSIL